MAVAARENEKDVDSALAERVPALRRCIIIRTHDCTSGSRHPITFPIHSSASKDPLPSASSTVNMRNTLARFFFRAHGGPRRTALVSSTAVMVPPLSMSIHLHHVTAATPT